MDTAAGRKEIAFQRVLSAIALANHENGIWVGQREMMVRRRHQRFSDSRHIAMHILYNYFGMSTKEVAMRFGLSNHSSVVHGKKTIVDKVMFDKVLSKVFQRTFDLLGIPEESSMKFASFTRPEVEEQYNEKLRETKKLRRLGVLPTNKKRRKK